MENRNDLICKTGNKKEDTYDFQKKFVKMFYHQIEHLTTNEIKR